MVPSPLRSGALLLLLILPLTAGPKKLERFEAAEPHMGTLVRITLYAPDASTAQEAFAAAFARVRQLDETLSDYKPDSELMRVCREASQRAVEVSRDLFRVLEVAQKLARETDGSFDVTMGPLIRLWRVARREEHLPGPAELEAAAGITGYQKLVLDPAKQTVFLRSSNMLIDLGGIAKGYAADEALQVLRANRISLALVAVGGDLAIGDPPPGRTGWRVGIEPDSSLSRVLVLKNLAVSTSGDREQFVDIGGVRYSHIVDPRTRLGLTKRIAVTIVAKEGIMADGLATALSVLGHDRGLAWIEQQPGVAAMIVLGTGAGAQVIESKEFRKLR